MEQQKLMDELNYHRAQKLTDALYHSGLISFEEYDKLTLKNRHSLSDLRGLIAENACNSAEKEVIWTRQKEVQKHENYYQN